MIYCFLQGVYQNCTPFLLVTGKLNWANVINVFLALF